jgi:anti-anti-sigma factor
MSQQLLRLTLEEVEDARLVRAAGEIDASTGSELRRHLEDARIAGVTLLLDLAEVTFMDSTGLRVLLDASDAATESGWPFFVVRPSATVQRVIALTSTADRLPLVQTSDRALA